MKRTSFFKRVVNNGIEEVDMIDNTLSSFKMYHEPEYYRVTASDEYQADLVSYRVYGTEVYWWIICIANKISNPLTELVQGLVIKIPSILDIKAFYKKYKVS